MSNTKELRRRIRSVKNMSQITKAMQMVAATKMRRAQNQATMGRPYTTTLHKAVMALVPKLGDQISHPLISTNDSQKSAALVISTDKGLCGSLNTNLFKAVASFIKNPGHPELVEGSVHKRTDSSTGARNDTVFYTIGKKGRNFVAKMGQELVADFENSDLVTFRTASQIGKLVTKSYINGEIGSFSIIYPDFVSALRQEPRIMPLLPINLESMREFYDMALSSSLRGENRRGNLDSKNQDRDAGARDDSSEEVLFEPNLSELLDFVVTHYVSVKIYQALLETKASEHSARMIAMQNATDNAKELVTDLTLSYNQTRQAGITNELLEITSALAALE
jgi:F-type H+-transporting ATPase subunit gamma